VKKQALIIALKYGVGLGLLAVLIWWHWHEEKDGQEVGLAAALERPINWLAFSGAASFCALSILLTFVRWYILVRAQDLPFSMPNAMRLGCIGMYWNTFLPGSIGGDIIKAAFLAREQSRRTAAVATILFDRFVGLCGLFWLITLLGSVLNLTEVGGSASLTPQGQATLRSIVLTAAALAAGSAGFWFMMGFFSESWSARMASRLERIPRIGVSVAELWLAAWFYRRRTPAVTLALGLAVVSHAGFVLTFYFSAQVLSPRSVLPPLAPHFVIVPAGMTFQALIPTPGGVGAGEAGFGGLYHVIGSTVAAGTLASLVQRAIMWIIALTGYLMYVRMKATQPAATPEPGEAATGSIRA
jgi:uncharacterized membrane protein YbhN (UPF0104 family)